jgi:LEA14-like dessication related protein
MKQFLIFALLLLLFCGCSKPVSPKYLGYEDFRVERFGLKNNVLSTRVKLYNPNSYALKLKSASIDVYLNDDFLGHTAIDTLIVLPGKDTTFVPLQLTATAKDLLSNTVKIWLNPDVKVNIKGSAKAGRGSVFINVPIDYEGRQRIEL